MSQSTKKFVGGILVGLAILAAFGTILLTGYNIASNNNEKVRELTNLCLEEGYAGFLDTTYEGAGRVGCYEPGDLG